MKSIAKKCNPLISTKVSIDFQLGESLRERSDCEKMLGVKLITNLILTNMGKPYAVNLIIN